MLPTAEPSRRAELSVNPPRDASEDSESWLWELTGECDSFFQRKKEAGIFQELSFKGQMQDSDNEGHQPQDVPASLAAGDAGAGEGRGVMV